MAQALVFAMWAVTRIFASAVHFTARGGRHEYFPFAAVAGVRDKRYYLAFALNAKGRVQTAPPAADVSGKRTITDYYGLVRTIAVPFRSAALAESAGAVNFRVFI